jgi:Mce-associated membrane protein
VEVALGRSGGEQVTEPDSRARLNIALYAATVLCACAAILLAILMYNASDDRVDGTQVAPGAGEDVGRGTIQAVSLASEEEQERVAAQLEAASRMVNAFVNFDYQDADATIEAVKSMSTGEFLDQYSKGAADLEKIAAEARSEMAAKVVWAGLVAGDDDSATVIVATSGTVKNKTTKFEDEARTYRIQVELVLEDGRWLTRDLQYVALG